MRDLTDAELDAVADRVADRLDDQPASSGVSLTRRQLLTIAGGGSAAVAALMALGVDRASAQQAAGQVGTSSDPVDVFASDVDVAGSLSAGQLATAIEDPSDVSGSRSFDTIYQNTNDYDIWVTATLNSDGTADINSRLLLGNGGPVEVVEEVIADSSDMSNTTRHNLGPVLVPPGVHYEITDDTGGGGQTITRWIEYGVR